MPVPIAPSGQPIQSAGLLGQLASGPPIGPIPTTPYAPANVQPLAMPAAIPGTPPKIQPRQQFGGGASPATGMGGNPAWGGFPTYQQFMAHKLFGLGGSPQTGMNQMGVPPNLQQVLMQMIARGGPGAVQGRGGMPDASGQGAPGDRPGVM